MLVTFSPDFCIVYCVLYIEDCVIGKTWCKYEPNQTTDYAVNPRLIMSNTALDKGCFNMLYRLHSSKQHAVLIMTAANCSSLIYVHDTPLQMQSIHILDDCRLS